jgi:hypothetical protein
VDSHHLLLAGLPAHGRRSNPESFLLWIASLRSE